MEQNARPTTEEWIAEVEDTAALARDLSDAALFVMGNVMLTLDRAGLLDAQTFIADTRRRLNVLEPSTRLSAEHLLNDVQLQLARRNAGEQDESH